MGQSPGGFRTLLTSLREIKKGGAIYPDNGKALSAAPSVRRLVKHILHLFPFSRTAPPQKENSRERGWESHLLSQRNASLLGNAGKELVASAAASEGTNFPAFRGVGGSCACIGVRPLIPSQGADVP
ncbi:hypothetical protein MTO96_010161 [Rhipicephalus appendiculatus]